MPKNLEEQRSTTLQIVLLVHTDERKDKHILLDKTFLKIRTQFTQVRLLTILIQFIHNLLSHHKIIGLLPCNVHVNFNVVNA